MNKPKIKFNLNSDKGELEIEIEVKLRNEYSSKKEPKLSINTSDVVLMAKEKGFKVEDVIKKSVVQNFNSKCTKGKWILKIEVPKKEKKEKKEELPKTITKSIDRKIKFQKDLEKKEEKE